MKKVTDELSFSDKISGFSKVKVTKPEPDALRSICGDKVQTDKDGNEYFIIPEHQAKYQAELHPAYTFSKGFLPKEMLAKLNAESERNAAGISSDDNPIENIVEAESPATDLPEGTVIPQELPKHAVKKHRGNPNWRKHKVQEPVDAETGHQLTEV